MDNLKLSKKLPRTNLRRTIWRCRLGIISKKDNRIFLRINHELKQAFAKACQEEGTSMSKVLEQYIIDFLKRKGKL